MSRPTTLDGFVIVGDEAWFSHDWERRIAAGRAYYARNRERRIAQSLAWQRAHPEQYRASRRLWAAKHRRHPVGSLHGLACSGVTRATGCVCKKIVCYDRPERVA